MGLGDVARQLGAQDHPGRRARAHGGAICTRTFIPVTPHTSIGVLGARQRRRPRCCSTAPSATTCWRRRPASPLEIEHPSGTLAVDVEVDATVTPPPGAPVDASSAPPASCSTAPSSPVPDRRACRCPRSPVARCSRHRPPRPRRAAHPGAGDRASRSSSDVLGLTENGRDGDSVYLRTWDDYEHHSLKLTAATTSGVGRTGLRASSQEALERRVVGDRGARAAASAGTTATRASARPTCSPTRTATSSSSTGRPSATGPPDAPAPGAEEPGPGLPGRGVGVRRLDHVNYLAADAADQRRLHLRRPRRPGHRADPARQRRDLRAVDALHQQVLRRRLHQGLDRSRTGGCTTSRSPPTPARTSCAPPTSPSTPACSSRPGPHKHAIQQTFFLYVYEPGGNRIELCNPTGRLVLAPDWEPVTWTEAERAKGQAWGLKTIESFHTHGTPPVD